MHPDAAPSAAKSSRRSNTPTPSGDKKDAGNVTLEKGKDTKQLVERTRINTIDVVWEN